MIQRKTAEQMRAEANVDEFRQQLGPFVVAAETTRMPMLFTNALEVDQPIVFANRSFLKLTGYTSDEVLGQSLHALLARGTELAVMTEVVAAFDGECAHCPEVHYTRKNGVEFWASLFITPVRDKHNVIVQYFVSVVDLTKQKHENSHAKMMIDELNHRVKNTLTTVQSIVSQALRRSSDREVINVIESRLLALSRSHDLLAIAKWEPVGLCDTVERALEAFEDRRQRGARFTITGDNLKLTAKATLALSIALHELATNAVKYGALSNAEGRVLVSWESLCVDDQDRLRLRWIESGGPLVEPPSRVGFGSRVLKRGLGYELEGAVELDFERTGMVCTIDVPLPVEAA